MLRSPSVHAVNSHKVNKTIGKQIYKETRLKNRYKFEDEFWNELDYFVLFHENGVHYQNQV